MDRHLSPSETARRFGVTIKALRLYERRGLLAPKRSEAGWRTYGPAQIARLHQILALKRLGLPLARIGELLAGADGLDRVLAFQEQVLARQSDHLSRALALIKDARYKLAAGRALSIDDLATLAQETVMTQAETKALFDETFARHFTEDERARIVHKRAALMEEWLAMKPGLLEAIAVGDPTTQVARDIARRCQVLSREMLGPDVDLRSRFQAFRDTVASDPKISGVMEVTPEMSEFLKLALTAK